MRQPVVIYNFKDQLQPIHWLNNAFKWNKSDHVNKMYTFFAKQVKYSY